MKFEELSVEDFRNSMGPVEKCLRDGGMDECNALDVIVGSSTLTPVVQKRIQEFFNDEEPEPINADEAVVRRMPF